MTKREEYIAVYSNILEILERRSKPNSMEMKDFFICNIMGEMFFQEEIQEYLDHFKQMLVELVDSDDFEFMIKIKNETNVEAYKISIESCKSLTEIALWYSTDSENRIKFINKIINHLKNS